MLFRSYLFLLTSLTLWLTTIDAYYIDPGCALHDMLIATALTDAFGMARMAADALSRSPRDPNVNRLIKLLFAAPDQDAASVDMTNVRDKFNGILRLRTRQNHLEPHNEEEVAFYCNLDRFKRDEYGAWIDSVTSNIISERDAKTHSYEGCKTLSAELAFTIVPSKVRLRVPGEALAFDDYGFPSQITICPWFLEWASGQRYRTWSDLSTKAKAFKWLQPLTAHGWPATPIDALNLFDTTLLHELSHTHAGGESDDVVMGFGGGPFRTGGRTYGWRLAKKLAASAPTDPKKSPKNNADNLALFGMGVRLLNANPALYVQDSGKVSRSRPSKRDVFPEYATTPVAFEGFITMIKEKYASASGNSEAYWQI